MFVTLKDVIVLCMSVAMRGVQTLPNGRRAAIRKQLRLTAYFCAQQQLSAIYVPHRTRQVDSNPLVLNAFDQSLLSCTKLKTRTFFVVQTLSMWLVVKRETKTRPSW